MKTPTEVNGDFDLVIDCSGSTTEMENAMSLLKHGGRLCLSGSTNPNEKLTLRPSEVDKKFSI